MSYIIGLFELFKIKNIIIFSGLVSVVCLNYSDCGYIYILVHIQLIGFLVF